LVRGLLGHDPPPQKLVLRGMADLEKTLAQRFQELNEQRARLARANGPLWDKLRGLLRKDPTWAASVRRKRRASRKSRLARRVSVPKALQQKERVFLGSLGGTRVAPFDYPWTWKAQSGSPPPGGGVDVSAFANSGWMFVGLDTGWKNASSLSGRAALGIFFQSPSECLSKFSFWANPQVGFIWEEECGLDSVHTDGFIGLFAASYDWAGNFTETLVDQMISLWSDDSWWTSNSGSGDSSGFPLSANFLVDADHWYALWVWCGGHASGDGSDTFWSQALSGLHVHVPSISWQVG